MDIETVVRIHAFLAVAAVTASGVFAIAWIRGRQRIRELEAQAESPDRRLELEEEVEDLRFGLDRVSPKIARLSKGQDFIARVMTAPRPELTRRLDSSPTSQTPHWLDKLPNPRFCGRGHVPRPTRFSLTRARAGLGGPRRRSAAR